MRLLRIRVFIAMAAGLSLSPATIDLRCSRPSVWRRFLAHIVASRMKEVQALMRRNAPPVL